VIKAQRAFRKEMGVMKAPSRKTTKQLVKCFQQQGNAMHLILTSIQARLVSSESNPVFIGNLFMSDEAVLHIDGNVKKQNCRLWGKHPPVRKTSFQQGRALSYATKKKDTTNRSFKDYVYTHIDKEVHIS